MTKVVEKAAQKAAYPPPDTGEVQGAPSEGGAGGLAQPLPFQAGRKIIKDGEMSLVVVDTDQAIDDVTRITVEKGGYLIGLETTLRDGFKEAKLVLGVPVEEFENLQRAVRGIALRALNGNALGVDVTDQYVDTQSRLANLEATQARIRQFLDKATTVEESLKVNAQLAQIEAEIEKVKGRLNFLKDRSAYSTLTVNIDPERPTPTPTATPTVTLTPTVTPSPTPIAWRPGETFHAANRSLGGILRVLGDITIWRVVVVVPVLVAPVVVIIVLVWLSRRRRARTQGARSQAPASRASTEAGDPNVTPPNS